MSDTNENKRPDIRSRREEVENTHASWKVENERSKEIIELLKLICDKTIPREHYLRTALFDAVRQNKPESVKFWLEHGANANMQDDSGITPLYLATEKNLTEIIRILIEAGADTELETKTGKTVWTAMERLKFPKVHQLLLEARRKRIMQADIYNLKEMEIKGRYGVEWFFQAIRNNDVVAAKFMIDKGFDVNREIRKGGTALHVAVDLDCPEIVTVLLRAGADVNAEDDDGETPLHRAALHDSPMVAALIKAGANVNASDNILDSPLHYAAEGDALNAIRILIDADAKVDFPGYDGCSPIFSAIFHEKIGAVNLLLQRGANVNFCIDNARSPSNGETPIHAAALYANVEIATALTEAGADVEAKSARRKKAIDYAIQEKKPDLVMFLLKCGAEVPDLIDYAGRKNSWAKAELWYRNVKKSDKTANDTNDLERLCRAIRQRENETSALMIRKRRTNPNAFDKHGYSPFHWAALEGSVEVMETLLEIDADLELPTVKGSPPLILSTWRFMLNSKRMEKGLPVEKRETLAALQFLLDRGAKPDAVNKAGFSLLHIAAQNGEIEIMQLLLDHGANLELPDENGRTPLFHAIGTDSYCYGTVKFLIDCGAKLNVRDREHGRTPLHMAALRRANKILNLLLDAGGDRNLKDSKGKTALDFLRKGGQ